MTKTRLRKLLRHAGITQRQMARDLGLAETTFGRWPEEHVPPYAALYGLAMTVAPNDATRKHWRSEMAGLTGGDE